MNREKMEDVWQKMLAKSLMLNELHKCSEEGPIQGYLTIQLFKVLREESITLTWYEDEGDSIQ